MVRFLRSGLSVVIAMLLVNTSHVSLIVRLLMILEPVHVALLSNVRPLFVMSKTIERLVRSLFVVIRLVFSRRGPTSCIVLIVAFLVVGLVALIFYDRLVWPRMVFVSVSAVVRPRILQFWTAISVVRP